MRRTIYPFIDGNYDPKAETTEDIKHYHASTGHVSRLLMGYQVCFPLFALPWAILIVTYCTCMKLSCKKYLWSKKKKDEGEQEGRAENDQGEQEGNKENDKNEQEGNKESDKGEQEGKEEMEVQLSIIFTLTLLFSLYATLMSLIAVCMTELHLDKDVRMWYSYNNPHIRTIYAIPIFMLAQDIAVLVAFVTSAMIILLLIRCCAWNEIFWWRFTAYSIVFPIINLAVHANHILIGFIHDQQHAVGAAIFYAVLIITIIKVLRMTADITVSKTCGIYIEWCRDKITSKVPSWPWCKCCRRKNTTGEYQSLDGGHRCFFVKSILAYIAIALFIIGTFVFIASVYIELPINNAFDEAPARIQLIYTAVLSAFIAGLTYWLLMNKKVVRPEVSLSPQTLHQLAAAEITLSEKTLEELVKRLRTQP